MLYVFAVMCIVGTFNCHGQPMECETVSIMQRGALVGSGQVESRTPVFSNPDITFSDRSLLSTETSDKSLAGQRQINDPTMLWNWSAFVLSLSRRPDRLVSFEHVVRQHEPWIIPRLVHIDALDGLTLLSNHSAREQLIHDGFISRLDLEEALAEVDGARDWQHMSPGAVGLYISHARAWHHIVKHNLDFGLIFEDDLEYFGKDFGLRVKEDFLQNANPILRSGREGMAYLQHCWCNTEPCWQRGSSAAPKGFSVFQEVKPKDTVPCTSAYLLTHGAAKQLLERAFPMKNQLDLALSGDVSDGLVRLMAHPALAQVGGASLVSDVQAKNDPLSGHSEYGYAYGSSYGNGSFTVGQSSTGTTTGGPMSSHVEGNISLTLRTSESRVFMESREALDFISTSIVSCLPMADIGMVKICGITVVKDIHTEPRRRFETDPTSLLSFGAQCIVSYAIVNLPDVDQATSIAERVAGIRMEFMETLNVLLISAGMTSNVQDVEFSRALVEGGANPAERCSLNEDSLTSSPSLTTTLQHTTPNGSAAGIPWMMPTLAVALAVAAAVAWITIAARNS